MGNLAVGIALGTAINSVNNISSTCGGDEDIPVWLAIVMLVTAIASIIGTVIYLYVKDSDFLKEHWERLIVGSAIGVIGWASIALILGFLSLLWSLIF